MEKINLTTPIVTPDNEGTRPTRNNGMKIRVKEKQTLEASNLKPKTLTLSACITLSFSCVVSANI